MARGYQIVCHSFRRVDVIQHVWLGSIFRPLVWFGLVAFLFFVPPPIFYNICNEIWFDGRIVSAASGRVAYFPIVSVRPGPKEWGT